MYVESKLKAATNDSFHFMFIPKYWSLFAKPDGDKNIVADDKKILPQYIYWYVSKRGKKTNLPLTFPVLD